MVKSESAMVAGGGLYLGGRAIFGGYQHALRGLGGFVRTASEFERFETILKTTEGSSEKARESLAWVSEFATKTPYELNETTEAFVKLRAYGLDPKNGLLQILGDTSAAMGKDINQAVEAIADAVTGENERLKEFGITTNTSDGITRYQFTDKQGVQQFIEANNRDRAEIEAALREIWSEKYGGAMQDLSRTFSGVSANLADAWMRFQMMVMQTGVFEKIKARLAGLLTKIDEMASNGQLQAWANDVGEVLLALFDSAWEMGRNLALGVKVIVGWVREHRSLVTTLIQLGAILGMVMAIIAPFIMSIGALIASFAMLIYAVKAGFAFIKLGAVILVNPIILVILAIGAALAGVAYVIYRHWDFIMSKIRGARAALSALWLLLKTDTLKGLAQIGQVIINWSPQGLFYKAFSGVMRYFGVEMPSSFTGFIAKIWQAIAAGIEAWQPLEKVQSVFSGVIAFFTDFLPNLIQNSVQGALDGVKNIAANIGDGIKNGVKGAASRVAEGAASLAHGATDKFKAVLGIHSPSRVFAQLASYIPDGVEQGIVDNQRAPLGAMQSMALQMKNAGLGMAVALPALMPSMAQAQGGQEFGGSAGDGGAQYSINIHINGDASSNTAGAIAEAVRAEIARIERERARRLRTRLYD